MKRFKLLSKDLMKAMELAMNKLLFVLILVLLSTPLCSQSYWFNGSSMSYKMPGESWSTPVSTNIPISMDADRKRIEVYSDETQIIDYVGFETLDNNNLYFGSFATDSDYKKIYIKLYVLPNDVAYLEIQYSNIYIKYELSPP